MKPMFRYVKKKLFFWWWSGFEIQSGPCIYYALSIPTELNLQEKKKRCLVVLGFFHGIVVLELQ